MCAQFDLQIIDSKIIMVFRHLLGEALFLVKG